MTNKVEQLIYENGVVAMITVDDAADAVPLLDALKEGGIYVAEFTFRTAATVEAIKLGVAKFPDMVIGAGTVLTVEQAEKAMQAGAKFIVSPGFSAKVVDFCTEKGMPVFPGVATPTDIQMALEHGIKIVKFFPADAFGGIKTIKAIAAPFVDVKFIVTGGVSAQNIAEYITFPQVFACGGSWMVKKELIAEKKFDEIKRLADEAIKTMLGFEFAHIGINMKDAVSSLELAKKLGCIFNMPLKESISSNFLGKTIEINKAQGFGTNGHIAIATNSIPRAMAYLKKQGIEFDEQSAKSDPKGNLLAIYLKGEFGGFAVHLLQKK